MVSTSLTRRLGLAHPLIQAPMVGVSTPALAVAVSNAGGLGSIGLGAVSSAAAAREVLVAVRARTSRPFNVNLFCHPPVPTDPQDEDDRRRRASWLAHVAPLFRQVLGTEPPQVLAPPYSSFLEQQASTLAVLLETPPPVVSFHFGLPPHAWLTALRDAGCVTMATATTVAEARAIVGAGVDVVIAQGHEAGGHRGVFADPTTTTDDGAAVIDPQLGTLALVRLLRTSLSDWIDSGDAEPPLLVAAGGIMDGPGIAAALALGADGAQLGTAFILCPESAADARYRAALQGPRAHDTRVSAAISGRPARGLVNRLFTDLGGDNTKWLAATMPAYPLPYDAAKALGRAADAMGRDDFAVQWAGQGAPLARAMPAAELVATLMAELAAVPRF